MLKAGSLAVDSTGERLRYVGDDYTCGTYVLRALVREPLNLIFGRFKGGKVITVSPGQYAYVGSALGVRGSTCLARRLLRHATRLGDHPPHDIRDEMLADFLRVGLHAPGLACPAFKKPKWNIDHLLNELSVELVGAYLIRSPLRIEAELGKFIENDPMSVVFEPGLGANDIPGNTHLLRTYGDDSWWQQLGPKLEAFVAMQESSRCL